MKKFVSVCLVGMTVLAMTGCSSTTSDLNEEQMEIVADYAAGALLSFDKHYSEKYEQISDSVTEDSTETSAVTQTTTADNKETTSSEKGTEPVTTEKADSDSMQDILGMQGFSVDVKGYELLDSYPKADTDDLLFVMRANENTKLLVVELDVKNTSGRKQNLNIMKFNARYRAIIDNTSRLSAQITLLMDGFNTFEGSFKKGETKKMVLVFISDRQKKSDINSLSLNVVCGDRSGLITLK